MLTKEDLFSPEKDGLKYTTKKTIDNEVIHILKKGNSKLKSFSSIAKFFTIDKYKDIDAEIMFQAFERGKYLHATIEMIDDDMFDDDIQGSAEGRQLEAIELHKEYIKLIKKYKIKTIANEVLTYNLKSMTYGIIDKVAYVNGKLSVIDFKTNSTIDYEAKVLVAIQTELYAQMLEDRTGMPVDTYLMWWHKHSKEGEKLKFIQQDKEIRKIAKSLAKSLIQAHTSMIKGREWLKKKTKLEKQAKKEK